MSSLSTPYSCPSCGAKVRISTTVTVIEMPMYVMLRGCALRLYKDNFYWRDAGNWGIYAEWRDGKLVANVCEGMPEWSIKSMREADGIEFEPCTRTEWEKQNKEHVK